MIRRMIDLLNSSASGKLRRCLIDTVHRLIVAIGTRRDHTPRLVGVSVTLCVVLCVLCVTVGVTLCTPCNVTMERSRWLAGAWGKLSIRSLEGEEESNQ